MIMNIKQKNYIGLKIEPQYKIIIQKQMNLNFFISVTYLLPNLETNTKILLKAQKQNRIATIIT